jgi:N-acetylmuramoyl-L-alanine amidase
MFIRIVILCTFIFILTGCVYTEESPPQIVQGPAGSEPTLVQPRAIYPKIDEGLFDKDIPRCWIPPLEIEKKWTAIVIHHSGTQNGNAAIFDKWHRQGNHWEGVGYNFVIGNGTNSRDGQVEVTFRWRQQKTGAHCKTPDNWANEYAVGICLVGDFNQSVPTTQQMQSLLKLSRFLQRRYNIPKSRVYGHNTTPGANATECPGKKFPMAWYKSRLAL